MTDDELNEKRSSVSEEIKVPPRPPDPADTDHVLPDEKLNYPTFTFLEGTMDGDAGSFDLEQSLGRGELVEWLDDLIDGLESHDVGVETDDEMAIFGVGPGSVSMSFEPDADMRGRLTVTIDLSAKLIAFTDDPDTPVAGARGGQGFIPVEMLVDGPESQLFRCWNWIDDPLDD